ncbi:C40 family peptidase [Paenibacillus roseipurpureus]|uniref:NlpC/P60 family protein n=1 Tax=Paenibacillus roseopurpureus TaxID=2918901 RepID=A0AA96LJA3_9BACL|nr:NlpC/P60 family protein [Paenibacillus sp. MBLB1832]WNR42061.1 NlpC/P60 family protein [Paenibacillus sp. MBLB1832]
MSIMSSGCTSKQQPKVNTATPTATSAPSNLNASMFVADNLTIANLKIHKEANGQVWVPLEEAAASFDYDLHAEGDSFAMGATDPNYSVKINQSQATVGDKTIELPQAPKLIDNKPYLTTQALSTLMGTQVNWNESNHKIVLSPINDNTLSQLETDSSGQIHSLAVHVNKTQLLQFAKKFLGVRYQFSAGPYERTHRFDCSSFVQYVYGHFGVKLPRSSRSQSQVGRTVKMSSLQPGDLMFFYTPGRYASNRIVGHVGIYAGNGRFINTYGAPGVIISDFNSYWKHRFLFGKRVA